MDTETPLYQQHVQAGARIVSFAGFSMPIQYTGIIDEHRAVRQAVGMFDLSHMGEFRVRGAGAQAAVDQLVTNDIMSLETGQIRYSPMCNPDGGIVDDLLVYRFQDHIMLVVNASNIDKDLEWVREHVPAAVKVGDASAGAALIAVQGPRAFELLRGLTDRDLGAISYYHFTIGTVAGVEAVISRTGYTGEDGFELYASPESAPRLWNALWERGQPFGLKLIGLGARDTLRLEAGYMLYGNDIDATTSPLEAGLGWTVKLDGHDFIGKEALQHQKADGVPRRMVQLEMSDRSIPRPHCPIEVDGDRIGELTSGTFSPTFGKGIGLGYVRTGSVKSGTEVDVEIRHQGHPARVVRKPLYKREGA